MIVTSWRCAYVHVAHGVTISAVLRTFCYTNVMIHHVGAALVILSCGSGSLSLSAFIGKFCFGRRQIMVYIDPTGNNWIVTFT